MHDKYMKSIWYLCKYNKICTYTQKLYIQIIYRIQIYSENFSGKYIKRIYQYYYININKYNIKYIILKYTYNKYINT